MRFNLTDEERKLRDLVTPYIRVSIHPFRSELDPAAPQEVKEAYSKLQELVNEHFESCRDF